MALRAARRTAAETFAGLDFHGFRRARICISACAPVPTFAACDTSGRLKGGRRHALERDGDALAGHDIGELKKSN
jgi:hypothetical protein